MKMDWVEWSAKKWTHIDRANRRSSQHIPQCSSSLSNLIPELNYCNISLTRPKALSYLLNYRT